VEEGGKGPNPEIYHGIEQALIAFVRSDLVLLRPETNERNISQRLALHLQERFPEFKVDCEYSWDGSFVKRADIYPENIRSDDLRGQTIFPDIVVHQRDAAHNLLVVEVACMAGDEERKKGLAKLKRIKQEFGFAGGLFLNFGSREKPIEGVEWI
jgi:hypothetical protein